MEPNMPTNQSGLSAEKRFSTRSGLTGREVGTAYLRRTSPSGIGGSVKVLGINALFHDPAAALVVDGVTVAALEEERLSRRKHGHRPVPFAAWELRELAARWCREPAGIEASDLDPVASSSDPALAEPADQLGLHD